MKQTLIAVLLLVTSVSAMADDMQRAITICTDKVIINTDSLNLPRSTTAYEVLSLLPDLVDRTKTYILQNYDIQINGKTVGNARDAVLAQIRISDIKCIEVSENTLSNASSMGESGSISLELRPATKDIKGSIHAEANNEYEYSGGLRIDHKSGKWQFQSIATFEDSEPKDFHSTTTVPDDPSSGNTLTSKYPSFKEYAAAFIEYRPNKGNLFKLTASETYSNVRQTQLYYDLTGMTKKDEVYSCTRNVNAFLALNYEHLFASGSKICAEVNYKYSPEKFDGRNWSLVRSTIENSYNHNAHNIFGEFKLEQPLFHPTAKRSATLELGTQYNIVLANDEKENSITPVTLEVTEDTYYLRPFGKIEAKFDKWQFLANLDYQHFSYETKHKTDEYSNPHHCENFTAQAVVMYSPNKRNTIRLRYIRSIDRPKAQQLYPYEFYDPNSRTFVRGNAGLTPLRQNAFDLDYSLNLSTADYHLEIKSSIEYSHAFDNISSVSDSIGVISYVNRGRNDVIIGDLGIYFRKSRFSVWFSSNVYHKIDDLDEDGKSDHYTYFNLDLRPVVDLGRGWMVSMNGVYNSSVTTQYYRDGEVLYGTLRVSKKWHHFSAYVYGTQNFLGNTKRETFSAKNTQKVINSIDYEYMHSSFGAGVRYTF